MPEIRRSASDTASTQASLFDPALRLDPPPKKKTKRKKNNNIQYKTTSSSDQFKFYPNFLKGLFKWDFELELASINSRDTLPKKR